MIMEILTSKKYDEFTTILGNRNVSKKKVERLVADINSGLNLLPYCPIVVYKNEEKFMIIDGQHRLEASKEVESPVHYVICEPLDLKQIARLNSRSDKWKNSDFLDCYVQLGFDDYLVLKEVMDIWGLVYSAAIDFLMFGDLDANARGMDTFRDGDFKANHTEYLTELMDLTWSIFDRYKFRSDRYLVKAMKKLVDGGKCDFDHLKSKVAEAPNEMDQQQNWKDYIYNIEKVYNHRCSNRTVIF